MVLFLGYLFAFVLYYSVISTKFIAYSTLSGATLNIILCLFLIPQFGLIAAALSLALSNLLISLLKQWFASKVLKINVLFLDLYLFATLVGVVSFICIELSLSLFIRICLFCTFLLSTYLLYFKSKNTINELKVLFNFKKVKI